MRHSIIIDRDKCVGCGACVKDCVAGNLVVSNDKVMLKSDRCIFCGHCEAICPVNAVQITGFEDESEEITEQTRLDPEILMQAIRTRRTIRQFKEDAVSKEILKDIIEAGRLAPTGGNSQGTSYIILDKSKDYMEKQAVNMFQKVLGPAQKVMSFLKGMEIDDNFFFKKAPIVILVVGKNTLDAGLAAENMAFMAEAHGLGVLYSGFFTMCANFNRKIKKKLKLSSREKVVTTLVIGYPDVRYHRTVRREKAIVKGL